MLNIKKKNVSTVYEELVKKVLHEGIEMTTEDGQKCKEIMNVNIEITDVNDRTISKHYPLGEKAIESYTKQLLEGNETNFVYDYHERIFEYPDDEKIQTLDQVKEVIRKLNNNKNSRRAVIITWNPYIDNYVKDVPCLQYVQFLIRDNKLYMTVLFRSNDLNLAFHSNVLGLIALGQMVADKLNVKFERYFHHSVSMHIYYERDQDDLRWCKK